jgi:hypothetical protein
MDGLCQRAPRRFPRGTKTLLLLLLMALGAAVILAASASAANEPPDAIITSPPDGTEVLVGDTVTFDGSASVDDDLVNLTYEWNFSGVIIAGKDKAVVQRTFLTPGDLLVVLRVIDSGGRNDTAFVTIKVRSENQPPVAVITSPTEGKAILSGRPISFDGSSSNDPDGGPLVYRWETNSTIDPIGNRAKFTVKLPLGSYQVILYVFDQLGVAGTAVVNITVVIDVPPTLSQGRVDPMIGPYDLEGGFNFTVVYRDADNDPPEEIMVKVGPGATLNEYPMFPSDVNDHNYRDGRAYNAMVPLTSGTYTYVFSCRDPFYACATVLFQGPIVYQIETISEPALGTQIVLNWTQQGSVDMRTVPRPGPNPVDVLMLSMPLRVAVGSGQYSTARVTLEYDVGHLSDPDTITLLWYDSARGLWAPATGQNHDRMARTVQGDLPSDDVVLAVFGALTSSYENRPPHLDFTYDIEDAFVDENLWFDASASIYPDGTVLLFYWDFINDGEPGPWVPGVRAFHVYEKKGTYQVVLRAIDGQNEHFAFQNVSIRGEEKVTPGPFDNTGVLFMLGSLLVIAFGIAVAYRLHRPKTYDDLFGKAYRKKEVDEYSQLFRKLTQEELSASGEIEEGPEEEEGLEEGDEKEE